MSITVKRPNDAEKPEKKTKGARSRRDSARKKGTAESLSDTPVAGAKGVLSQPITFSRKKSASTIDVVRFGEEPRVDLLPPDVRSARRNRRTRRGFGWGVLVVGLAVIVAIGGAFALNVAAQAQLIAARMHSTELLVQQKRFSSVRDIQKEVAVAEGAQQTGASTEIDWKSFLDKVATAQPAGLTLTSLTMDSASPIAVYQQSSDPLQGPRVGTVEVVVSSTSLPDVPAWVLALQKIPGVVDVVPGSVTLDQTAHVYSATVTIHVDDSLYTHRFDPKGK